MSFIEKLIKRFFPNKIITYRLSDLIQQTSNNITKNINICVGIETHKNNRQFCYLTINELKMLYEHCPVFERSIYELIPPENQVKAYIDFEYYLNNNLGIQNVRIAPTCCLKILHLFLNSHTSIITKNDKYIDLILKHILVLEATTTEKVSYHFIHANPSILFQNNVTLGLFIKAIIHFLLSQVALNKCSSFNISVDLHKCHISDVILLLTPYVNILRTNCTECYIYSDYISVGEIAYLLVLNKDNQYTLAIDLNVYSKNQQFRLFDCFICQSINTKYSNTSESHNGINLTNINTHVNSYFVNGTNFTRQSHLEKSNTPPKSNTRFYADQSQKDFCQIVSFVERIIKSDQDHQGYIRSSIRGTRNSDTLFFNIGGNYRFCPLKNSHHQRNSTAIIVDIKNRTFAIRCKDPECKYKCLIWNKIE